MKIQIAGKDGLKEFAIIDADMFDYMNQFSWHLKISPTSTYIVAHIPVGMKVPFRVINSYVTKQRKSGKLYKYLLRKTYMHWVVLTPPKGLMIDHINRNTLDNRRENLRIVTRSENRKNAKDRILGL